MGLRSHSSEGCADCEGLDVEDKATFLNPEMQSVKDYWSVGDNQVNYECYTFSRDAYDMKVTFTRKPVKAGDLVRHDECLGTWKVLAIHEDRVWLTTGNVFRTYNLDDVRPA